MAAEIEIHRLAQQEFEFVKAWYEGKVRGLGDDFETKIKAAIDKIEAGPEQWPKWGRRLRWVKVKRFPYCLYYEIMDDEHVLIVAVAHHKRRHGYWRRRRQ